MKRFLWRTTLDLGFSMYWTSPKSLNLRDSLVITTHSWLLILLKMAYRVPCKIAPKVAGWRLSITTFSAYPPRAPRLGNLGTSTGPRGVVRLALPGRLEVPHHKPGGGCEKFKKEKIAMEARLALSTFCSLPINFERKKMVEKKVGDGQKVPMASHHGRGLISRENGRQAGFGGRRGSSHLQCLERRKLLETTRSTLQNPLLFHYIIYIYYIYCFGSFTTL